MVPKIRYLIIQFFTFVFSAALILNMRNLSVFMGENSLSRYSATIISFLFFFLAPNVSTIAQSVSDNNNHPLKTDDYKYRALNAYVVFLDSFLNANSQNVQKKIRKDYKKIIVEKNTELVKELSESNFLFDNTISSYLSSLFYSIIQKNDLGKFPFHFFVSRSSQVNAYSFDDCTVVCNAGLLNVIENESQLAMVFCHEIAHYLLGHATLSVTAQLEKYYSPEFLAQVKAIKKETYNTKSKLEVLLMQDMFNRRKHNRGQEIAADSLGMLLYLKTGYNRSAVPQLYDRLDKAEESGVFKIRSFIEQQGVNVDEKWFDTGRKMSFGKPVTQAFADSFKTHPDCSKRKTYATTFLHQYAGTGSDFLIATRELFATIKKLALFEQALYMKEKKNMSQYFFQLVQADSQFPGNRFITAEIFNTLCLFALSQKNHTLFSITDKSYSTNDETDDYAHLLNFLDRVELQQLAGIAGAYYSKHENLITRNTETNNNLEKIKQLQ